MASLQAAGKTRLGHAGSPIRLYDAEPTTYAFHTDRGPRTLETWRLTITHVHGPIYVLDAHQRDVAWTPPAWQPHQSHEGDGTATLLGDGINMAYTFTGSPRTQVSYPRVRLLEDRAVVVLAPEPVDLGHGPSRRKPEMREVAVRLRQPLGNRVLVDSRGVPVTVTA